MVGTSRIYKAEGIILKRKNVGEADRIITIFTREYGKLRVIAKGIRKISSRRAGHLEIFRHVQLVVHKGNMLDSLSEVQGIGDFPTLAADLQKISFAYYLCELVDQLTPEHQVHREVFLLLVQALGAIDDSDSRKEWQEIVFSFAIRLLGVLGFLPQTDELSEGSIGSYIESITERKLRTPALLTTFQTKE